MPKTRKNNRRKVKKSKRRQRLRGGKDPSALSRFKDWVNNLFTTDDNTISINKPTLVDIKKSKAPSFPQYNNNRGNINNNTTTRNNNTNTRNNTNISNRENNIKQIPSLSTLKNQL
jgi:hypothetical protein